MDGVSRDILLGVVLGILLVIGIAVFSAGWGARTIQTASLPIDFPILFQPK